MQILVAILALTALLQPNCCCHAFNVTADVPSTPPSSCCAGPETAPPHQVPSQCPHQGNCAVAHDGALLVDGKRLLPTQSGMEVPPPAFRWEGLPAPASVDAGFAVVALSARGDPPLWKLHRSLLL